MLRRRSDQQFLYLLCAVDVAVTAGCWVSAYFLRWHTGLVPPVNGTPPLTWCVDTLPVVALAALVSYQVSGLYQLRERLSLVREVGLILRATGLLLLIVVATTFYTQNPYQSRLATGLFWGLSVTGLVLSRRLFGAYFRYLRYRGKCRGRALIVGTGRLAQKVEAGLRANNWLALTPYGYVDDDAVARLPTVGNVADLPMLIREFQIDYVFVALPLRRYEETRQVFRVLAEELVEVRLVPEVPNLGSITVEASQFEGLPVLTLQAGRHGLADLLVKRAIDFAGAAAGLLVLSPLLAALAVLVKATSRGPVLYGQERMGLNGHRFTMYKFRSMRTDAEDASGPVWTAAGDDRRTPIGRFLRETSLDELPQLLNVLRGDMSLVGPRPERPYFIRQFRESIPRYMQRHAMKAGITGWAQVHGWRGSTSLRKRVQYDLYYISHWSFWMDLRILGMTLTKAMWDKNAY